MEIWRTMEVFPLDINLAYEHVAGHSEWVDTSKNGSVSAAKEIILGQEPVYWTKGGAGRHVFVIIVVSSKSGLTWLDKGYLQNEVLGNVNLSPSIILNPERLQDFSWFSNMSWIFDFACCWCIDCYKSHWPARSTAFPWTFGVLLRPSSSWPLIRCFSRHGGNFWWMRLSCFSSVSALTLPF